MKASDIWGGQQTVVVSVDKYKRALQLIPLVNNQRGEFLEELTTILLDLNKHKELYNCLEAFSERITDTHNPYSQELYNCVFLAMRAQIQASNSEIDLTSYLNTFCWKVVKRNEIELESSLLIRLLREVEEIIDFDLQDLYYFFHAAIGRIFFEKIQEVIEEWVNFYIRHLPSYEENDTMFLYTFCTTSELARFYVESLAQHDEERFVRFIQRLSSTCATNIFEIVLGNCATITNQDNLKDSLETLYELFISYSSYRTNSIRSIFIDCYSSIGEFDRALKIGAYER